MIVIVIAGGAIGAAIGDRLQPDLYIFNGSLSLPSSDESTSTAKQAHIIAIRSKIPAAAATLNAQGIPMSAAEFNSRMTLTDVPGSREISIRCSSRSFDTPLAMVNALIIPYCASVPGMKPMPGALDRSVRYASAGFVVGGAAAGLMIVLRRRQLARTGRRGWVV